MRPTRSLFALCFFVLACVPGSVHAGEDGEQISELLTRGNTLEAKQVHPAIWVVSGNSNAYLVTTDDGAVVIDTGLGAQGVKSFELLRAVTDQPVRKLILTHAHADHVGGALAWREAGAEVIASRQFPIRNEIYDVLRPFQARRAQVLWADVMPPGSEEQNPYPHVPVDVLVDDAHAFEVGGRRFEVIATPGGEGTDGISVWIPELKALFPGDTLGPATATFPNLFTLRGENMREVLPLLASIARVLALEPERVYTGHFEPLEGADEIRSTLERTRDGVRYVHDAVVAGMNAGTPVWQMMREIALPPELELSEQYGRVPWGVRAIWESYVGWFKYESTTELYDVPASAVSADFVALAGGPGPVAARAAERNEAGEPLHALHLAEAALTVDAGHAGALSARLAALESLGARDGGENFQLGGWLRHEIAQTRVALDAGTDHDD